MIYKGIKIIMKEEIRKKYIEIRKKIKNKKDKSNKIFNEIIKQEEFKSSKIIAIYKNLESEVDTNELIKYCLINKKTVVLPRVVNSDLKFYRINGLKDDFEKSKFGVEEPKDEKKNIIREEDIDLVIVPGVCFDLYKNRLGFGKGYYDRLLGKFIIKNIAICFEEQLLLDKILPVTDSDIKIQKIITDKRTIM